LDKKTNEIKCRGTNPVYFLVSKALLIKFEFILFFSLLQINYFLVFFSLLQIKTSGLCQETHQGVLLGDLTIIHMVKFFFLSIQG